MNDLFERPTNRWHVIDSKLQDVFFCENDDGFAPWMSPLVLPRHKWEIMGYKFISKISHSVTWDEYLENYHNQELATFKSLSLEGMCDRLRKIYVECEIVIKNFNSEKRYSKFREILNNTVGVRHGKINTHTRPITETECVIAFKEYQQFVKID